MASTQSLPFSPTSTTTSHRPYSSLEDLPFEGMTINEITTAHPLPRDGNASPELEFPILPSNSLDKEADNASIQALKSSSVYSSLSRGILQNGRRYQAFREGEYWSPSDAKQFESQSYGHVVMLVLDVEEENRLFRSPIAEMLEVEEGGSGRTGHVLDVGTGDAVWAVDVADAFPDLTVHGVDLDPPPQSWVPPNCILEVDDLTQEWTWSHKFDLIHLRRMLGSFTEEGWRKLYAQAYENLQPGGWIEQVEPSVANLSDDSSLPPHSLLSTWGDAFLHAGSITGRPMNTIDTMRTSIQAAGFVKVHEKLYKSPFGAWPKHPVYKDAGRLNEAQFRTGMEGYAMSFFVNVLGWEGGEVKDYLRKVGEELGEKGWHKYHYVRRVWAQKPYDVKGPSTRERDGHGDGARRSLDEITLTSERAYSFVSGSTALGSERPYSSASFAESTGHDV